MRPTLSPHVVQQASPTDSAEARARQINQLQADAQRRVAFERGPLDGAIVLDTEDGGATTGIAFTGGTAKVISHGLGRRVRFVVVLATWSGTPALPLITVQDDALDAQTVQLTFASTCRVTLAVA